MIDYRPIESWSK